MEIPSPLIHAPSTSFVSISNASRRGIPSFMSISTPEDGESPPCPLVHVHFDTRRRGFPAPSFMPLPPHSCPFPMPAGGGSPLCPLFTSVSTFNTRRRGSPLVHTILTTPTVGDPPSPSFASVSTPEATPE